MSKKIREPIQVYLTETERSDLDVLAGSLGVSRSEALRRGVSALTADTSDLRQLGDLVAQGVITPARRPAGALPHTHPVGSLREILDELGADRGDR